jgi:hypothetical protein
MVGFNPLASRAPDLAYGSVRVYSSNLATQTSPRKQHKKTASMSDSYHNRVQKKWLKRYGTKQVPGAYELAGGVLVMHPELVELLKREIGRAA